MTSKDSRLLLTTRDTVLTTGIFPTTTMSIANLVGDTGITVVDPTQLHPGALLLFFDRLGEYILPIQEAWNGANPVNLDFTGTGLTGLQYVHPIGTSVGHNVYHFTPAQNALELAYGNPMVYLDMPSERDFYKGEPLLIEPDYIVNIYYRLSLVQQRAVGQDGLMMNPTTWVDIVRQRARSDMEQVKDALLKNWFATDMNGEQSLGIGEGSNPGAQIFGINWGDLTTNIQNGTLQAAADATMPVRGEWYNAEESV